MGFKQISCVIVLLLAVCAGIVSASGESLDRAKSLYASAAYDEALTVLDQLSGSPAPDDSTSVAAYRVYCLLALDRQDEARAIIDRILHQSPLFMPSADEAPPKIQTLFRDVRRATLPKIARERYTDAKAAYERKDPQTARRFDDLLTLLEDPDLREWSAAPDLRAVAAAFRDLAKAVAAPALAAPVVRAAEARPAEARPAESRPAESRSQPVIQPAVDAPQLIYSTADADVTPPITVTQRPPQWRPSAHEAAQEYKGVLRLVIDRWGTVESATMASGTRPTYDQALLRAARDWKFQPAQKDGRPVRYLKVIEIHLTTAGQQQ